MKSYLAIMAHAGARKTLQDFWPAWKRLEVPTIAFLPAGEQWLPWCQFIEVPRFDDIWMGWLWQREVYRRRHCFRLDGPLVRHERQSDVWANLRDEARYLQESDHLWRDIASEVADDYDSLLKLLPAY